MQSTLLKSFISLGAFLSASAVVAQPPSPPATPIDGGLSILLAAGGIYGIKRMLAGKNSFDE